MINIALCDDDVEFLNNFEQILYELFDSNNEDIHIYKENDSFKFAENYRKNFFDLIFLDICMPNINGLELAEKIRTVDSSVEIIFVSSFENCVYRSFKFRPFRFLRKHKINDEISNIIDDYIKCKKLNKVNISLKFKNGFIKIDISSILYFNIEDRKIYMHTLEKEYNISSYKFNDLVRRFEDNGFLEVHRGFLVNKDHIKKFEKNTVTLTNNVIIPVSRYKLTQVEKIFI